MVNEDVRFLVCCLSFCRLFLSQNLDPHNTRQSRCCTKLLRSERIEVIGVTSGYDRFDEEMDVSKVHGHDSSNDCKVELDKYIRMVYPKVNLTFRAIDEYDDPFSIE